MAIVMKRIINGERPQRPRQGETLGLSDELWEVIRSSLGCELERRPSASTFVGSLEKATPDIAVLKELTKFDANSEGHIQKLRHMFELGDNTLLGMREKETLTVIEVFDQVSLPDFLHLSNFSDFIWFQVLNSSLNDPTFRSRCLHGLKKVSSRPGLLPKSYLLSHNSLAGHVASSATEKVSRRRLSRPSVLAVSKISTPSNVYASSLSKLSLTNVVFCLDLQRLSTNAILWKQLQHPNVVSFVGLNSNSPISLAYNWMPNENLPSYVRKYPGVDKLRLVCGRSPRGYQFFEWF